MGGLAEILGLPEDEPVLLSVGPWTETRAMMTTDGTVKFKQVKAGSNWLLYEIIDPKVNDWYKVEAAAAVLGVQCIGSTWQGPLDRIPQQLLLTEDTIMVRSKKRSGWVNIKSEVAAACEGTA